MKLKSNQKGKQMFKVTRRYTERKGSTVIPTMLVPHLEYYFLFSLPHLKNTEYWSRRVLKKVPRKYKTEIIIWSLIIWHWLKIEKNYLDNSSVWRRVNNQDKWKKKIISWKAWRDTICLFIHVFHIREKLGDIKWNH